MTAAKAALRRGPLAGPSAEIEMLRRLIDWPGLARLGWDPERQVFAPGADDPVLGLAECKTAGCEDGKATNRWGLCYRCLARWRRSAPGTTLEDFCATGPAPRAGWGRELCVVCRTPGHERPQAWQGLCASCTTGMLQRGQTRAEYLDGDDVFPPATPRPSFGRCRVVVCQRWAHHRVPTLCASHYRRWAKAGRPAPFTAWCAREPTLDTDRRVAVLGGLGERARLEVLYGVQCRALAERRTTPGVVQMMVNLLQAQQAASVFELSIHNIGDERRLFVVFIRDRITLAMASPETERAKDVWDLRVFGRAGGRMHFAQISQPWLAVGAKQWAFERLDTAGAGHLERIVQALGAFSSSLRRHRPDRGNDPVLLSRADILAFSNDLAHMEAAGRLSPYARRALGREVAQFLREARGMGLSAAGGPLAGLGDDVVLQPSDRVRGRAVDPDNDQARALPQVVVDQLLAPGALEALEAKHGVDTRAMVELQAQVGRRTGELCQLRWDCLSFDEVLDERGQVRSAPVLVHDMPKVFLCRYRLPINQDAAEIIGAQQARMQGRFPHTDTSLLALFPMVGKNPRGTKACSADVFGSRFRTWVDSLAELVGPGGERYDRSELTVYSFRHTYAQRHADSGTPVEVLAALMGHKQITTTQGYYRVTQKRKRRAVDLLAALQVDHSGDRSRPAVERLLDTDHVRDAVGQVAVPFGICTEPTNVKAHGQGCPFRHQCFGCTHFRSDPSFLPELRAHLSRLLADQERLRAAAPQLEDWARNQAIPSAEEIGAVRRIIERCQALLEDVAENERAEIDQALAVLRRGRAQLDTSVPVRFLGVVGQRSATLFPNVAREQGPADEA